MFPTHDEPVRHIILFKKEEGKTRDLTYLLLSIIRSETRELFLLFKKKVIERAIQVCVASISTLSNLRIRHVQWIYSLDLSKSSIQTLNQYGLGANLPPMANNSGSENILKVHNVCSYL